MTRLVEVQDIVDLIVDHLADIIRQELYQYRPVPEFRPSYPVSIPFSDLKRCALINKAFAFRSQKYLFSTLKIWAERDPGIVMPENIDPVLAEKPRRAINNLLRIFDYKPYLARHLHTIEVVERFRFVDLVKGGHDDPLTKLLDVLQSEGNPRDLVLNAFHYRQGERLDYGIQESIAAHLQSLRCIALDVIPILLFSKSTELRSLELTYCSGQSLIEGAHNLTPTSPRPKLKRFTLNSSWIALGSIMRGYASGPGRPALDFSNLNYLHVTPPTIDENVLYMQQLLDIAGSSLQTLDMSTHPHEPQSYSRRLDLSLCIKLHTVKLLDVIHEDDTGDFDRFLDMLSTIRCPNTIKGFHLDIWLPIDICNWSDVHARLKWETVDEQVHRISNARDSIHIPSMHDEEPHRLVFNVCLTFYGTNEIEGGGYRDEDADTRERQEFVDDLVGCRFPSTVAASERIKFEVTSIYSIDYSTSSCYGSEEE